MDIIRICSGSLLRGEEERRKVMEVLVGQAESGGG